MDFWDIDEPYDDDYEDNDEDYGDEMSSRDSALKCLESMMGCASGNSFILMMESPHYSREGHGINFSLHPRFNQPCYGGELRKYESSHPHECTQPQNQRPSDLYHPFPEGRPSALGLPYWQFAREYVHDQKTKQNVLGSRLSDATDQFFHDFFQDDNPWARGFGGFNNVQFYDHEVQSGQKRKSGQKRIGGVILKNLSVDPTVTVHMNWFIRDILQGWIKGYEECLANGLSKIEAYAFLMNNSGNTSVLQGAYYYQNTLSFSARRFFEQKPLDLTGGTLTDRYDYNRTNIQDLWCNNFYDGDSVSFVSEMNQEMVKEKNIMKAAQTVFQKMAQKEGPIIDIPWKVEMTGGRKKPTIHKYRAQPSIDNPLIEVAA